MRTHPAVPRERDRRTSTSELRPRRRTARRSVAVTSLLVSLPLWIVGCSTPDRRETPWIAAGRRGIVACDSGYASEVGVEILRQGGNAIDAAAAVSFALGVVRPYSTGLGGGGFMLVHVAETGETVAIDYREKAPVRAHKNMFLDDAGQVVEKRSRFSHLSAGVPGTVAGLTYALKKYGTMPLDKIMAPAIKLAEEGFTVKPHHVQILTDFRELLQSRTEARKIFYKPDGSFYEEGEVLVQKDLAGSLRQIAEQGPRAFYEGAIAKKIAADMKGKMRIGKLDVDKNPVTAGQFGIRSIPTLFMFKGGKVVEQMVGAQSKDAITGMIRRHASGE